MKVSELKLELDAFSAEVRVRFAEIDTRFAHIEARIAKEGETTRSRLLTTGWTTITGSTTFTGILDDHELRLKALEHYRRPR